MLTDTIQSIMTVQVVSTPPGTPLKEAVAQMNEKNISCIIISLDSKPVGIITERDMLHIYSQNIDLAQAKVDDVMSSPVKTVSSDINIYEAADYLQNNNIRRIVIVDKEGRLMGLVTQSDLTNHLEDLYYHRGQTVESIMTREVVTAGFDEKLPTVIHRMFERNMSCIIICKGEKPVGILTERDILHLMLWSKHIGSPPVSAVIERLLITITPEASLCEANLLMKRERIRRLVVVNEDKHLLGLLTQSDLVKNIEIE